MYGIFKQGKNNLLGKPNLVLLPGGPGLGAKSFYAMEDDLTKFNLHYYFPPGVIEKYDHDFMPDYEYLIKDLEDKLKDFENLYLCGHSFGGIQIVDLLLRGNLKPLGVVLIAAPFTKKSLADGNVIFRSHKNASQITMDELFNKEPTDDNYRKWFTSYVEFYFPKDKLENGKKVFAEELYGAKNYFGAYPGLKQQEFELHYDQLKQISIPKLFIAGSEDFLFRSHMLREAAINSGFEFIELNNIGHFVQCDDPQNTAKLINNFIFRREKE